jgi:hypothetical protein
MRNRNRKIDAQVEAIKVKLAEEMPVMIPFNQLPGDGVDPDPNNPDPNQPQE